MGTSNAGILRAAAAARDASAETAGTLAVVQEVLTRVTNLQVELAAQGIAVEAIQDGLAAIQTTLSGIKTAQASHTTKIDSLINSVAVLPAMRTQLQEIHDAVVTTP